MNLKINKTNCKSFDSCEIYILYKLLIMKNFIQLI